jgi:hypothetical protein
MDLIRQYNKYVGENKNLIQKALTSANGSGQALIPEHLEQIITNAVPRIAPEVAMMAPQFDSQSVHSFNRLSALGGIGGAMGESATTPTTQPTFQRATVNLKVIRRKGATTNFLQDASKRNLDAAAANIEAQLTAHVYDMCNYIAYGNATANTYEFSGWDTFIVTNRSNEAQGGATPTSLSTLDDMIDKNLELQGMNHRKAFIMSPQMLSKFSQLLTNVRLNQGLSGQFSQVEIGGGWRLNAYRDIPIIISGSCRPKATMGTVTPTHGDTGGTILDNVNRYFMVSYINRNGEQVACTEVSQDVGAHGAGNIHTITLSWTAVTDAYRYKIYVGSASGTVYLKHVVPGFTYDSNGTITGSTTTTVAGVKTWTSDANGNVNTVTFLADPVTAGVEVPTGLQTDIPLVNGGGTHANPEYLWLIDFDEFQGLGRMPFTNSSGTQYNGLVTIEDLAKTDDYLPFLIKSYCAVADSFESTSVCHRGLRTI